VADLSVKLGPLCLEHPVINASGTMEIFELAEVLGPQILKHPPVGIYVSKTITLQPRTGNPAPRILETAGGMINAVGLPGAGVEVFVVQDLPRLLALPCPLILSIGGFSTDEYVTLATRLRGALDLIVAGDSAGWDSAARASTRRNWIGQVGLELNISCPNVHSGCASIGASPQETREVVTAVRKAWPGLLVAKLTPNVADITVIGCEAAAAGADAIAAVNTYKGLVIDRETLRPYLGNITGGVSGPAIKPLALRAVYDLFRVVDVPIIGMGGIATVQDVLEFISCGARVIAVGSAGFREPSLAWILAAGLGEALDRRDLSMGELLGKAHQSV
jgi:dihydroorotate dehydrogenase (NAD+) catalytic subunit